MHERCRPPNQRGIDSPTDRHATRKTARHAADRLPGPLCGGGACARERLFAINPMPPALEHLVAFTCRGRGGGPQEAGGSNNWEQGPKMRSTLAPATALERSDLGVSNVATGTV